MSLSRAAIIICVLLMVLTGAVNRDALRWRAGLFYLKATGQIAGIDWTETWLVAQPNSRFDIARLIKSRDPYKTLANPFVSSADRKTGQVAFRENCSGCHGADGKGASAPDLVGRPLGVGDSDWAIYRTISHGLPAQGMPALPLSARSRWQIVAFLRSAKGSGTPPPSLIPRTFLPVTPEALLAARATPENWLTYSGGFDGWRYSPLGEINRANVKRLRVLWIHQISEPDPRFETTPLVVNGTIFITTPTSGVKALDARDGKVLWVYQRPLPPTLSLCCGRTNRGVAIMADTLYLATLDAHLVALDAHTGAVRWDVEVADSANGYSLTCAPLAIKDFVLVGTAGGEFRSKGHIAAFDARTGRRRWVFHTIPEPGQPGIEKWGRDDSAQVGGGPAWLTGSYDPDLNLVYWGVGNPNPDFDGDARPGDNLYTSLVALDLDTGELHWWFQFSPHDEHDWDAAQIPVLIDEPTTGRGLVVTANKNGFYYVLDRATGRFVTAQPFVQQTWADGLDGNGRPKVRPGSAPSRDGSLVVPGSVGATNWWSPSYSPGTGLFYVTVSLGGGVFFKTPGSEDLLSSLSLFSRKTKLSMGGRAQTQSGQAVVRALDPLTGDLRWEHMIVETIPRYPYYIGGVLCTGGGLVFAGGEETLLALDAATGELLWRFHGGHGVHAAPISYLVDQRQRITVPIGRALITFGLDE